MSQSDTNTTTSTSTTTTTTTTTSTNPGQARIKKLSNEVVNRIAAGEVIQRPANAVKEMIENCIDAKATSINVIVKNGGLKSLQIQDNGHGIKKEDMDIVCERFTTSKLEKYEDLKSISTYGFRGEALASISHVAHVTITTMTADSPCAYKASYSDGKLVAARPGETAAPKSCAGVKGTQILVEDLFYNVPTRRKAIKNGAEEHQHIVAVMTKYAIHNSGISFSCKKHGESSTDVHTQMNNTTEDNIRLLYGQQVARELIHVSLSDTTELNFKLEGHITNANFNMKKMAFILFINHRLVESKPLKTALDSVYTKYLPKGSHPFLYISLEVAPHNVDVNVHPTKQEVRFLHEDQIIEKIQKLIEDKLLDQNKSRTFYTQSLLPGAGSTSSASVGQSSKKSGDGTPSKTPRPDQMVRTDSRNQDLTGFLSKTNTPNKNVNNNNNNNITPNKNKSTADVDMDDADDFAPSDKNIVIDTQYDDNNDDFVDATPSSPSSGNKSPKSPKSSKPKNSTSVSSGSSSPTAPKHKGNAILGTPSSSSSTFSSSSSTNKNTSNNNNNNNNNNNANNNNNNNNNAGMQKKRPADEIDTTGHVQKKSRNRKYKTCELTSIQNMVSGFQKNAHEGLLDLFKNHIFVGCVDRAFVLIQYRTKLYLLNMVTLSKELIYQEIFHRFGDFDRIKLSTPIPLHTLFLIALESPLAGWVEANGDKQSIATKLTADMMERSEMLREYVAIDIDADGNLCSLPQVLDDYIPQLKYLPLFILWLATDVEWEYEVECFEGIARQMADFYCIQPETVYTNDPKPKASYPSPMLADDTDPGGHSAEWVIQHIVFPALRRNFYPPKGFSNDGTIIQIAQLENLYKIFERC